MENLGEYLRNLYIRSNFINSSYDESEVYVRSSSVKRCLKSMNFMLHGMFPDNYEKSSFNPIPIETIPSAFDYVSLKI